MINATITKFGYPHTLVREYQHWLVLLRPSQVTVGSLVLAANSPATAYGELPASAFAEQAIAIADIERALSRACDYRRINYLMLMMVDAHVHFHVIPRYQGSRSVGGITLSDTCWPGAPDLKSATALDSSQIASLRDAIAACFR